MAAAQNGTIMLLGQSGKTYSVDLYAPDAVAGLWGFNANGTAGATSPTQFRVPENCLITDISIATGTTAVGAIISVNNSSIAGGVIRYANYLNTLTSRPSLRLKLNGGDFIGATNI